MKKKLIILSLAAFAVFAGCKKEKNITENPVCGAAQQAENSSTAAKSVNSYKGVQLNHGIMEFTDGGALIEVMKDITDRNNNNQGEGEYKGSTKFEESFNFSSLRMKIELLRKPWLENEILEGENDPADKYIANTAFRTVLNEHSALIIEGKIFIFRLNSTIIILDGSWETYNKIINNSTEGLENVEIQKNDGTVINGKGAIIQQGSGCFMKGTHVKHNYSVSGRVLKSTLSFINIVIVSGPNFIPICFYGTEATHFVKKGPFWIQGKSNWLWVRAYDYVIDGDCSTEVQVYQVNGKSNVSFISAYGYFFPKNYKFKSFLLGWPGPYLRGNASLNANGFFTSHIL